MNLEPVPDETALLIDSTQRTLVLADLHIGIEAEYHHSGVTLPSQLPSIEKRTHKLVDEQEPDEIVLLGDIKNTIRKASVQEKGEVPGFLKRLADALPVHILPGNHDGLLRNLVPRWDDYAELITFHDVRGTVIDNVGLFHGHTYPSMKVASCEHIVMGHQHPSVAFRDELGTRMSEMCWVRAPLASGPFKEKYGIEPNGEVIVMPAFSEYGRGSAVNDDSKLLGPFLSNGYADMEKASVYLMDGVYLGEVSELRPLAKVVPGSMKGVKVKHRHH